METEVNKTDRTVRSYLNEAEKILAENNMKLVRKTNVGIYIEADENTKNKFKDSFFTLKDSDEIFSAQYRQKYILMTLLENKFAYTIQMFADELYCSKSTIVNDLTSIQKILEEKKLILRRKQNQGLWIEGKEEDYRNALKELVYNTNQNDDQDLDADKLDYRIDFVNYKSIKGMFPDIDILFIQDIIQKAEEKLGFYFTEQAFLNLVVHITISIDRIRSKKYVEDDMGFIQNLKIKNGNEYSIANWITDQLKEKFKIDFPEKEVSYIAVHVLGGKIQENHEKKDISLLESSSDEQIIRIAKNIMKLSSEILGADITKDKNLLASLILHLKPTIIRLKYGLKLSNPMLETIKRDYTSIMGMQQYF